MTSNVRQTENMPAFVAEEGLSKECNYASGPYGSLVFVPGKNSPSISRSATGHC